MIEQQDINNIISIFEPSYAAFVTSDFATQTAKILGRKHQFSPAQTEALQDGITLYLLAVYSKENLTAHLSQACQMSLEDATMLIDAVLSVLPPNFEDLQSQTYEFLQTPPQPTPAPAPVENPSVPKTLAADIAETEAALKAVPHMRTMAKDIAAAQGIELVHTSASQEDILKGTKGVDDGPRWGSVE